jgi:rhodanese-related sulfurtransferase
MIMASFATIQVDKLSRLVGTPASPLLIDVRDADGLAADPYIVPGSIRRDWQGVRDWAGEVAGSVVTICQKGKKLSEGAAAWLRTEGAAAESLDGGIEAWREAGLPLVPIATLPNAVDGRTLWVTRSRPKIDRIACPWLIRRFVDPNARFLFVAPAEVEAVAERFGATPFDIEGVHWSHRGENCTFDAMIEEFGLRFEPLQRLALIVRGADTARPDLAPEVPGLLAASLGLSRLYSDDLEQLEAGIGLYDAFYRWCRDATEETHNWPGKGART